MKKLTTLLFLFVSAVNYGQNPKRITSIPGSPSSAFFSWPCNGLQFYQDYNASTNNTQIWRTDGTANGTFPITNFAAGTGQVLSNTQTAAVVGTIFYFSFNRVGAPGYELWKTDGTLNGTVQVSTSPVAVISGVIVANSTHIFITSYPLNEDLYSIDNSGQVTYLARLRVTFPINSLTEGHAAIFRDKLVVTQSELNGLGNPTGLTNLVISDGTVNGTYIQATQLSVAPRHMIACGDNFLLMQLPNYPYPFNSLAKLPGIANGGIGNLEIFYTPSGGDDLNDYKYHESSPYGTSNGMQTFQGNATLGSSLLLSGRTDNHGWELWKTDGTAAGTVLIKDIYPGVGSAFEPWNGFVINGKFIFDAYTNTPGRRIFYTDGTTAGTDFFPQRPVSNDPNMSLLNVIYYSNKAYFRSLDNSGVLSLWQTDGGLSNTVPVTPYNMSVDPHLMPFGRVASGNILYKSNNNIVALSTNYKLWNGSADNAWNNTANWENNIVPSVNDDILIPGSVPNYPVINGSPSINSLWINSYNATTTNNAMLNINSELGVSIYNTLSGSGTVNFTGTTDHVFSGSGTVNVPINMTGGDVYSVDNNKTLSQLNFQSANKFFLGDNSLTITEANGISGFGADRFIVTNGTGRLTIPVSTNMSYPIGSKSTSYTPLVLSTTGGSISLAVRVSDSAYTSYAGTQSPDGAAETSNAVSKSWYITNTSAGGITATAIQFQWNADDQLPGFDSSNMKAAYKWGSGFEYSAIGSATGSRKFTYVNPGAVITVFKLISDIAACICPGGGTTLLSPSAGSTYQWQVNAGAGFTNISDNVNYSGTNTSSLQLSTIPTSFFGYEYRCVVDGIASRSFIIRFENLWTGAASTAWENPANWSCGILPDANTDVIFNSGTIAVNSNVTCRSIDAKPGTSLTINPTYTITVTGQ